MSKRIATLVSVNVQSHVAVDDDVELLVLNFLIFDAVLTISFETTWKTLAASLTVFNIC